MVWRQMDEADPRSPLPSLSFPCRKNGKGKRDGGDSGGTYARVQEELDESNAAGAAASAVEEYGLLWRMWRVTKPLVSSQGKVCCFFNTLVPVQLRRK